MVLMPLLSRLLTLLVILTMPLFLARLFFFSSRRRHTRCSRDWSSDVCSSDLVRPVNGGAMATGVPPCDPATSCRPGVTPADAQTPNGRIDSEDAVAVASVVVGVSVPVVGQVAPTASATPDTAVASVTISPAPASVQVGQTLQLTATPKDSAGCILACRSLTWSSGSPAATILRPSGTVTSVSPGHAPSTSARGAKVCFASLTV